MRARGAAAISKALLLLAAALVCLATLTQIGCGGGGDGASTGHRDSGGGAAQFEVKGGDNSLQRYGSEAAREEFEQAAAALHGFLGARAEHDWALACRYLGEQIKREIARPVQPAAARAHSPP